jgi:hypothetical protein
MQRHPRGMIPFIDAGKALAFAHHAFCFDDTLEG